jgi:hypothetical protein
MRAAQFVVTPERVVRERLASDPRCSAMILFDLERELFFAAPELDHYLDELRSPAIQQGTHFIVLRLKRIRNPDVVCLERIEHFLKDAENNGITVLLAGVRPDFLQAITRLHIQNWYPQDHIFPEEGDDTDSATLKAVRCAYRLLGDDNKMQPLPAIGACRKPRSQPLSSRLRHLPGQRLTFQHGSRFKYDLQKICRLAKRKDRDHERFILKQSWSGVANPKQARHSIPFP